MISAGVQAARSNTDAVFRENSMPKCKWELMTEQQLADERASIITVLRSAVDQIEFH
tara:strand:- start:107 stop:277 length:171 start_codon:yes stop_codon:yes gene_type:complete